MRKICTALVITCIAAASLAAYSKQKPKPGQEQQRVLKVATDATWPPMEYITEQKEIAGFDIDVIEAAAKAAGFRVEIQNAAWDGIFVGLANGNYDMVISSVTITEERKRAMDFSSPYINAGQVILVRQETEGVATLKDLAGGRVGAQIGTTGAIAVSADEALELKTYDELGLAIEDLVNGKIQAVVADTPIAADFALNNPQYKSALQIVGEPFTEEYYGIAVKKDNQEVLALVNQGLKSIQDSGELERLRTKWLK